jgi:cell division protein FtsI/penicillin-binding protein 2
VPENTIHIQLDALNELNVLSEADMTQKMEEKHQVSEEQELDQNIEQVEAADEEEAEGPQDFTNLKMKESLEEDQTLMEDDTMLQLSATHGHHQHHRHRGYRDAQFSLPRGMRADQFEMQPQAHHYKQFHHLSHVYAPPENEEEFSKNIHSTVDNGIEKQFDKLSNGRIGKKTSHRKKWHNEDELERVKKGKLPDE